MSKQVLVDQSYWDQAYNDLQPTIALPGDHVRQWVEASLPKPEGDKHCLEIGCYPGRYLAVIGKLGYVVHGVDLTPAIDRMAPALAADGIRVGEFKRMDFLKEVITRRYDVVCSFGFIEHFPDWRNVLRKHAELVAPGGLIMIETPNFRGWVQQLFHRLLDSTNLRRHHIPAMQPDKWTALLRNSGFEVLSQGYLGRFDFWTDSPPPNAFQRLVHGILRRITPLMMRAGTDSPSLAPYCVLIARKPQDPADNTGS